MSLEELARFDPELARMAAGAADRMSSDAIEQMVGDTLWASAIELGFGRSVLKGYLDLSERPAGAARTGVEYHRLLRRFGAQGPLLGSLMAAHLPPVLGRDDPLLRADFLRVVEIMHRKGSYCLPSPLRALSSLLKQSEDATPARFLELLEAVFSRDLSYVRCQHFAYILPRAVMSFATERQPWQTAQLCRVVKIDPMLADPFLDGMRAGLNLLSEEALAAFVERMAAIFARNPKQAVKYISLSSRRGTDTFRNLQVTVSLGEVQAPLNRYLQARLGGGVSVRPLSSLPAAISNGACASVSVVSDSRWIYLPDEIGHFADADQNRDLYKTLTRLECGLFEFGTFDFDIDRITAGGTALAAPAAGADLAAFLDTFPDPLLAEELFTIFEHGRLRKCLSRHYPGLSRRCLPLLQREATSLWIDGRVHPLQALYGLCALGMPPESIHPAIPEALHAIFHRFDATVAADAPVEACGRLVLACYDDVGHLLGASQGPGNGRPQTVIPFGRRLRPDLVAARRRDIDRKANRLKDWLYKKGYRVTTADLRRHLTGGDGRISAEAVRRIVAAALSTRDRMPGDSEGPAKQPLLDGLDQILEAGLGLAVIEDDARDEDLGYPVFRYDEWDDTVSDYLRDHVRICQRPIPETAGDFYSATLSRHRGLVRRLRIAFELLKPEGLKILRRWVEGDEFDYRALIDAAVDRRAGQIPSERLYNKRVKQQRDVSVLLLVDLSRSTSNMVQGSQANVLDVEKEALVLFCEALKVVGDDFCIAGFSGTGRLGVDYYLVKDFDEEMNDRVCRRIDALAPQRATRMGAAIRHATARLVRAPARVHLLIVLGDGFPNDVDYKQGYAVADTRRAFQEARSKSIFAHAITVNLAGDPRLDDLYGHGRHTVISDVRELPDKLLRVYGSLTKY